VSQSAAPIRTASIAAFVLLALIWGSTWLVIKGQIGLIPAAWSVTWRFALAAPAMFVLAALRKEKLLISPEGMWLAALIGVFQFSANFQFVYQAEKYLTSGLVAVIFALLLVPNTLLAWIFVGASINRRFLAGSAVALGGIGLLLLHEYRAVALGGSVLLGIGLTAGAIFSVSISNVSQASQIARRQPMVPFVAWSMLSGAVANFVFAWTVSGPPALDTSPAALAGIAYLAIAGSVVTFPLYFALIRDWGPGKAAYNSVAVPVVAMALSTVFEGYQWSILAIGGALLAMVGLLIALGGRNSQPASSAASPSR
jgi:drug/metabolite transporter (DMT)-like permease